MRERGCQRSQQHDEHHAPVGKSVMVPAPAAVRNSSTVIRAAGREPPRRHSPRRRHNLAKGGTEHGRMI
jgi:hypothetical protein